MQTKLESTAAKDVWSDLLFETKSFRHTVCRWFETVNCKWFYFKQKITSHVWGNNI